MQGVFLRNFPEGDAHGAQGLRFCAGALVHFAVAVFDVAQHGFAQIGQMGTDLVGAAGDQADLAQRKGPGRAQHIHIRDDLFAVFVLRLMGVDAHLVVLFVVLPPCGETPALGDAHRDGIVLLLEQVGADDLVHVPQGGVALGSDDKALGATVQPVADAGLETVLTARIVLSLLGQILGECVHKVGIAGAVAVAEQVSGLVQHGNVLVLVDDGHFGLVLLLFGGGLAGCRLCALGREEFIVDVQLNEIARLEPILGCALFAVDLDPLVAEALVQQAGGEIARHALDKAGKPHALVVCGGSKLFHKIVPFVGNGSLDRTSPSLLRNATSPDRRGKTRFLAPSLLRKSTSPKGRGNVSPGFSTC